MDRLQELNKLSTFDLAFNLATGKYSTEADKFAVLEVIRSREAGNTMVISSSTKEIRNKSVRPPLKGSKAEKILKLIEEGKTTAKEVKDALDKKKVKAYYPEIYRVFRDYRPDLYRGKQ